MTVYAYTESNILQDSSLRFQDDDLFKAFHAASDAVCETADAGSLSIRLPAVKLMESILLILTSPVSTKLGLSPKEVQSAALPVQYAGGCCPCNAEPVCRWQSRYRAT